MSKTHLVSFDYIRGFAALAVVIHHVLGIIISEEKAEHPFWTGAAGVDVFFVLSGYLIYSLTMRGGDVKTFLGNRAIRILPTYTAVCAFYLFAGVFLLGRGIESELQRFILSVLFVPHTNHLGNIQPIVGAGWTLTYEAWFYCFAAFCLLAKDRRILVFWTLPFFLLGLQFSDNDSVLTQFLSNQVIFEFWLGAAARLLIEKLPASPAMGRFFVLFAVAVLILDHLFKIHSEVGRFFIWGIPAFFIVYGCANLAPTANSFSESMARTSYPVYLLHTVFIIAGARAIEKIGGTDQLSLALCIAIGGGIVVGSYASSYIFEKFFERPVMARLKATLFPPRTSCK